MHLTHWGRMTHICVSTLTIISSDNGLSPGRRQAIIWTNAWIMLIWTLKNKLQWNENSWISFKKVHLKCRLENGEHFVSASVCLRCCQGPFLFRPPQANSLESHDAYMRQWTGSLLVITITSQWARWRLKSSASRLLTQPFIQAQIKETIRALFTGLCAGNSSVTDENPAQMASNAENVSIRWRHHVRLIIGDKPLPKLMTYCQLDLWELQQYMNQTANIFIKNSFENVVLKMVAIFPLLKPKTPTI